ncbi:MAG: 4Fe-4S binding protein [Candidatus Methanofastidiosia archaeon]|jgi:NAD-dependent dihydropyrimidine dehydrogenase PreA subunit
MKENYDSDNSPYEKLRKKMSIWIVHIEKSPELMEILRIMFTTEEAELLSEAFSAPFQEFKTVEEIAQCTEKSEEKVRNIIKNLKKESLIFSCIDEKTEELRYSLLPLEYGSLSYLAITREPEKRDVILPLFQKICTGEIAMGSGVTEYPWGRIIPVGESVVVVNKILPYKEVKDVINTARTIAVVPCFCRTQNPCTHPVETCMGFNEGADYMVEGGFGRYLNHDEALDLLDTVEDAGLVHTAVYTQKGITFMCNCCICACPILRRLKDSENPRALTSSGEIPQINQDVCTVCGTCIEICPLDAHCYYPDEENPEIIGLKENQCVGCGLCMSHCSNNAITMVPVKDVTV